MMYIAPFVAAFVISLLLTPMVRRLAVRWNIYAKPDARKVHTKPVAYLGGVAIFLGFLIPALAFLPISRRLLALIIGVTLLVVVGVIDDIRPLSPWHKLAWQLLAAFVVLAGGIGITVISNPFGGVIDLSFGRFAVHLGGWQFHIAPLGNLLTILWMVGMINVINFLDGLDGLAGGVSGIAGLVLFFLSISTAVNQPEVAILAILIVGAVLGFLPYNFFPAQIFMGDGGAYFLGVVLALLAIYSGGKLATAGLVLGFPILDGIWTVLRRLRAGTSPFKPDKRHFHHLLLAAGLSQRAAVLVLYGLSALFGSVALLGNGRVKVAGLVVLAVVMLGATAVLGRGKQS